MTAAQCWDPLSPQPQVQHPGECAAVTLPPLSSYSSLPGTVKLCQTQFWKHFFSPFFGLDPHLKLLFLKSLHQLFLTLTKSSISGSWPAFFDMAPGSSWLFFFFSHRFRSFSSVLEELHPSEYGLVGVSKKASRSLPSDYPSISVPLTPVLPCSSSPSTTFSVPSSFPVSSLGDAQDVQVAGEDLRFDLETDGEQHSLWLRTGVCPLEGCWMERGKWYQGAELHLSLVLALQFTGLLSPMR